MSDNILWFRDISLADRPTVGGKGGSLGELAMDVMGPEGDILPEAPYGLSRLQSMFLFVRSDTIYGGTNQIQRDEIARSLIKASASKK